jgi:peptide/nickel transport system substrate-binding protein
MSRLRHSPMVLLMLVLSVLLAACGGSAPTTPANTDAPAAAEATTAPNDASTAPTEAPAEAEPPASDTSSGEVGRADTLIFAADLSDQISFDPAVAYEFGGIQVVGNIYQTLLSADPGVAELKPLIAKSWDIAESEDGWLITFTLDERAKFASGNPITAEDVVYSFGRVLDVDKSPVFLFSEVAKLSKENMTAVDPQTVEIKLPKDASPQVFLSILSFSIGAIVEKALVEANAGSDFGSAWLNDNSAGSGPYVLTRWERNVQNVLDINPNYWLPAPAFKRVIMRNETELANLQAAIETGDADIVEGLGSEQVAALDGHPDITLVQGNSTSLAYLGMNATKAPLDNVDVREAIRYAINYDEVVTLLGGNGTLVQEIIPKGLFGHTGKNPFSQDIAKAKELLAKAGVAEGTEIEFLVPDGTGPGGIEWSTMAAKIQNDVAQIGLKLNIKQIQYAEVLNTYRAQGAQLVIVAWGPDYPDPDGNVTPLTFYDAKSIAWRNDWNNPEIGALGQQAALETDTAKRAELYAQLVERVFHEGPYAVLYQPTVNLAVRNNIKGVIYDANDTPSISFDVITK